MPSGCLTVEEAAKLSGLTEGQIRQLCKDGEIYTHNRASGQDGPPWAVPPRSLMVYLRKKDMEIGEGLLEASGHVSFR